MRPPKDRGHRKASAADVNNIVCYCEGARQIGTLELFCQSCSKWFHGSCLKDLQGFYGLPFMICYQFHCKDCSPTKKESWVPKQANFIHMCVTVLANLTAEHCRSFADEQPSSSPKYFNIEKSIIPYCIKNWEHLTSMPRRIKNTWHATVHKTLSKEVDLFRVDPSDANSFALVESDLRLIGPIHEAVKQIGKKTSGTGNLTSTLLHAQSLEKGDEGDGGPKTRGASKRKKDDGNAYSSSKKLKFTADYSSARLTGSSGLVDIPFNKEGYHYYIIEKDYNVYERPIKDEEEPSQARAISGHSYRVATQNLVTISPNDRAYQLKLSEDELTLTGHDGYCLARASHSVASGSFYFEVNFVRQPPGSHIRIGWSQKYAVTQACVGYNKFSYGWRSLNGTKFHNAHGKTYARPGFKEGDVLGCLISLSKGKQVVLPPSGKDCPVIKFKNTFFFEANEDAAEALKKLEPLPGSKIEFFRNGKSCGVAFEDIYAGFYYPAVSIFHQATVRLNFGPRFSFPPPGGVRPMSERAAELPLHQTLSDMLFIVERDLIPPAL